MLHFTTVYHVQNPSNIYFFFAFKFKECLMICHSSIHMMHHHEDTSGSDPCLLRTFLQECQLCSKKISAVNAFHQSILQSLQHPLNQPRHITWKLPPSALSPLPHVDVTSPLSVVFYFVVLAVLGPTTVLSPAPSVGSWCPGPTKL